VILKTVAFVLIRPSFCPSLPPPLILLPLPQVFLPESDIDMVVLPPQELPVHQVRNNLFQLAEVCGKAGGEGGMEGWREGRREETVVRRDVPRGGGVCLTRRKPVTNPPPLPLRPSSRRSR